MATKKKNSFIFNDFKEYWYYSRSLDNIQKKNLYMEFPKKEQDNLIESYWEGYWDDVLCRDLINIFIDEVKEELGYDIVEIHNKIKKNKSVYLPRRDWEYIMKNLKKYSYRNVKYLLGDIKFMICEENEDVVLLMHK